MTAAPRPPEPPTPVPPAPAPRKAGRNIVVVMLGTLGSRLSGIVRQLLINAFPAALTDAFLLATRVPNTLRELLAEGALVNAFIPVYKSLDTDGRRSLARAFSGVLIAVNLILMALGILAAPWIAGLLVPPGSQISFELVVYMTRLLVPFLMLISLSAIAMGLLNADEHFRESSFAPVAFNIASIAILLLLPHSGTWLALGWLIGGLAQLLVQLPSLNRFGLLPTPALATHPAMRRVLTNMAPFTLTAGARQILNFYVQRLLSSGQYPLGTVTGYNNAETLFTLANGLFVVSPALAYFPRLSQNAADRDWASFRTLTLQALRLVTFLAAPTSALLVALSGQAVSIFNLSHALDASKFRAGSGILEGWALALVPWAVNTILLRTFYARERVREAVTVSAVGFVAEVLLYRVLTPAFGYFGFGLATTITGTVMSAVLFMMYRRRIGFALTPFMLHLARVLPIAAVAGLVAWRVAAFLPAPGRFLPGMLGLVVAGGAGGAVYLALAAALRLPELQGLMSRVRRR
ncbi:murein biosynthesis integral membrane protein MurJ [Deinococcus aquiradiocola]|uniref:Probable lipid II flippase MurJ n=1 Tax=Deinococcus aquiradiocola TaxID=393059 RepID=A0A917PFE3_9DEIO|nr:murein biosynthesis integral membrane protein MurJ [Deinococcus aquiradiocola]GGJ73657.1 lipid II flippase MurJ [Deinococcus aquiradiocola]